MDTAGNTVSAIDPATETSTRSRPLRTKSPEYGASMQWA
jgi:DNA-binding beta-propeller fold protein YncE